MIKKNSIFTIVTILFISTCFAQTGQTGNIKGIVTGPDNLPLPGVQVILESPALVTGQLNSITGAYGEYHFPGLAPGKYDLNFKLAGMTTIIYRGIQISAGKTSSLDIEMTLQSIEETINVEGKSPTIDRQKATGVSNLDIEFLDMIPTPNRSIMDYFNITPGITENTAHGSGQMENSYNLDGVNMGDPVTGTPYVTFGMDIMEEISVQTGGLSAEYGSVKGSVLNIVTRSGGNEFHGTAGFYFDHETLQAGNTRGTDLYHPDESEKNGRKFQIEPGFTLGGAIIKNKLWFFGNLNMISKQEYIPGYPHDKPTNQSIPPDQKEYFPYIKLTFQPRPADKFMVSYNYSDLITHHREASRYYNETTTLLQTTPTHVFNAHWTRNFGTNFYTNLKLAFIKFNMNLHAKSPGVQYSDWLTGFQTGTNWRNRDDYKRDRFQVNLDATTFIDNVWGSHELKIGGELQAAKTSWILETKPDPLTNLAWEFDWPEYLGGSGIYYGFHIESFDRKENMLNYSLFINDTWNITRNLTLNLGLRYDYNSIIWPAQNQDEIPLSNPWGLLVDRRIFKNVTPLKWRNLSPRLGLVYDLFSDGKTLFKASWSSYVMPNTVQWANLAHPNGWYYWIDVYYGYTFVQISQSLTRPGGTKVGYKNHNLVAPTSSELTVGFERELSDNWSLGIRYIKKWDKNLIHVVDAASLDINALMDQGKLAWLDWEQVHAVDPYNNQTVTFYNNLNPTRLPEKYIVNPPGADRNYDGVELKLSKKYAKGWALDASYVYANARGLIALNRDDVDGAQSLGTSDLWSNPNAHINAEGRFPYERRHQLKITGLFKGPLGINIGGYFRLMSGQRWTRAITSNFLGVELNQVTETIKAEKRGAHGYPPIAILDLKIEKEFKIGNRRLKVFSDIFNFFNNNTVLTEYLDSSNPAQEFGYDLAILSPRVMRLGIKIEF
ncbi:MAG: TonB-dependent receptor [Acidobacteria bacterium]|jgi:outer membrane receptor protein involved in Fe transport|nr:TonB-dependent receptor [Acidobacteriota bacterium]